MKINTQEDYDKALFKNIKCKCDCLTIVQFLGDIVRSMLPTEKQLEESKETMNMLFEKSKKLKLKSMKNRELMTKLNEEKRELADKLEIKSKWCHTQEERHHECNPGCKNDRLLCCFCGSYELCDSCQNSIT